MSVENVIRQEKVGRAVHFNCETAFTPTMASSPGSAPALTEVAPIPAGSSGKGYVFTPTDAGRHTITFAGTGVYREPLIIEARS